MDESCSDASTASIEEESSPSTSMKEPIKGSRSMAISAWSLEKTQRCFSTTVVARSSWLASCSRTSPSFVAENSNNYTFAEIESRRCARRHDEGAMSSGDPDERRRADRGLWAVRARSGSREPPPPDEPPPGAGAPRATEPAPRARGTAGRGGPPGRRRSLAPGAPPPTAGRQGQRDHPLAGQPRVARR